MLTMMPSRTISSAFRNVRKPSAFTRSRGERPPNTLWKQQQQQQQYLRISVRVAFINFGKNAEQAGIVGAQRRDDYSYDDVDQYFNYMGMLASEGTFDRIEALMKDRHPADVILILAAIENDVPKLQEILQAGADPSVKGLDGKTPFEYATSKEAKDLLKSACKV